MIPLTSTEFEIAKKCTLSVPKASLSCEVLNI